MDLDTLKTTLSNHGQSHLLQHWDSLTDKQRAKLYEDLTSIDLDETESIFRSATAKSNSTNNNSREKSLEMVTIEDELCASVRDATEAEVEGYRRVALEAVGRGEVGVLLLAGGQGTRLGVPYPKGMFSIGLPSDKTLYQIQAERILRLQELASKQNVNKETETKSSSLPIVMYIMTSERTKQPTAEFFERHGYFGMRKEDVVIFEQRMIPCYDFQGRLILEKPYMVARSPDGNGGLYWALKHEGILDDFDRRGVKFLHAYCVDNVLVKVADPVFMGYAISKGAESANKVVEKAFPEEAVGVVCRVEGKIQVVEYSEIPKETSELRNPSDDDKLVFKAGNICNHFFTSSFLRRISTSCDHLIPYHLARKAIAHVDNNSLDTVTPREVNGLKCEKFVFDVFQFSRSFLVWECIREEEFSPLKNAEGTAKKDTPKTARMSLYNLHRRYLEAAGGSVVKNVQNGFCHEDEEEEVVCEISPLVSYAGEGLEELVGGKKAFKVPVMLK